MRTVRELYANCMRTVCALYAEKRRGDHNDVIDDDGGSDDDDG